MLVKSFGTTGEKLFRARVLFLSLLFVLVLSGFAPLPQETEPSILDKLGELVIGFASLAGVAAVVTAIVSFARSRGWVETDEQGSRLMATLNFISFFVLVYFRVFRPDLALDILDGTAAQIATVLVFVLGLIGQMLAPAPILRLAYQAGVPGFRTMGARAEYRAHFVGAGPEEQSSENWTTDPKNKSR